MRMIVIAAGLLLLPTGLFAQTGSGDPVGRPEVAKAFMESEDGRCMRCHGVRGEGAYGPDLAGRGLSFAQFKRAVRQPWGVMFAYNENQISDQLLADLYAYFATMPKVATPGPWRTPVPAAATPMQRLVIDTAACGQCHGAELATPRRAMGGEGADFALFAKNVYEHSEVYPKGKMGNYSRGRLPESVLREIWQFMSVDLGLRADVTASVNAGRAAGTNVTYDVTVENIGHEGKGLAAEGVTIALALSPGATVVSTTGAGYQGVRRDAKTGMDVATWTVARVAAAEKRTYTLTLTGAAAAAGVAKGSAVSWAKPALREGAPNIVSRDDSVPVRLAASGQTN